MDKNQLGFAVFCIESVAAHLNINGKDVYTMLASDSDILDNYIVAHYDVLHTQGKEYIVRDIVEFMTDKGLLG